MEYGGSENEIQYCA